VHGQIVVVPTADFDAAAKAVEAGGGGIVKGRSGATRRDDHHPMRN
jgi:hypothetical protein